MVTVAMHQRRVSPFTPPSSSSSSSDTIMDSAVPRASFQHSHHATDYHHLDSVSHNAQLRYQDPPHEFTPPTSEAPEMSFNPWLLDGNPSASPLSSDSSLASSPVVAAPPYVEQTYTYRLLGQPLPLAADDMVNNPSWVNNSMHNWQRHFSDGDAWITHPLLPSWDEGSYGNVRMPSSDQSALPFTNGAMSTFTPPLGPVPLGQSPDSASFTPPDEDNESDSGSETASDDSSDDGDDSSYSQRKHRHSHSHSKHEYAAHVTNHGKLGLAAMIVSEPRNYICPLIGKPTKNGICTKRFNRPEHLRRHLRTVHSDERPFICKVPSCYRPFSRGDNLREHYWTHLDRGGRSGSNQKMSLKQLKVIIGHKDRDLYRKLKLRLLEHTRKPRPWPKSKL